MIAEIAVLATGGVILLGMILVLARAFLGPTVFDRILAVNAMGTKAVIFVAILGFIVGRPEWLDIALLYGLINFVTTISILKFQEFKRLS